MKHRLSRRFPFMIEDTDLPNAYDPPVRMPRDRMIDSRPTPLFALTAVAVIMAVLTFTLGSCHGTKVAREAVAETRKAEETAAKAAAGATYWKQQEASATATVAELRIQLADETQRADAYRDAAQDASETIASLRARIVPQSRVVPPVRPLKAAVGAWSREQVASTLRTACAHYSLEPDETAWVVTTGLRIAYRESRYRPGAINPSGCVGLFQFNSGFGAVGNRLDPVWSCYRFVRVYAEGGEAAVRRHWAATV